MIVTTNPGLRETAPFGPRASLAFELTDAAPTAVDGDVAVKGVIAQHQLRMADARVLVDAADDHRHGIPAGTVLSRVTTDDTTTPVLWCDLKSGHGFRQWQHDCLADPTGSGRFDEIWSGVTFDHFLGFGPSGVTGRRTLTTPVAYRTATVAERPTALLGYQWCDGDGISGPLRFAYAVSMPGDERWSSGGALVCNLGAWIDPKDHGRLDLDGHVLTVTVDAKSGSVHYHFEGRLPPMKGLKTFAVGQPPFPPPAASTVAMATATAPLTTQTPAPDKPLIADGRAPTTVAGPLVSGQAFFTVGVRHGLTGVLINAAHDRGLFSEHTLPVGTPVYGIPMAGSSAESIVWCAPQKTRPEGGQPVHWTAICMPVGASAYMWTEAKPALMTLDLNWTGSGGKLSGAPSVDRQAISMPPMTLSYAFGGWTKKHWLTVLVQLDWGEGPQTLRTIGIPPADDGAATLRAMGGQIVIRPLPTSGTMPADNSHAIVEILAPPRPDAEIAY